MRAQLHYWIAILVLVYGSHPFCVVVDAGLPPIFSRNGVHHHEYAQQSETEFPASPQQTTGRRRGGNFVQWVWLASSRHLGSISPEFAITDDFLRAVVPGEQAERISDGSKSRRINNDDDEEEEEAMKIMGEDDTSLKEAILGYFRPTVKDETTNNNNETASPVDQSSSDETANSTLSSSESITNRTELQTQPPPPPPGAPKTEVNSGMTDDDMVPSSQKAEENKTEQTESPSPVISNASTKSKPPAAKKSVESTNTTTSPQGDGSSSSSKLKNNTTNTTTTKNNNNTSLTNTIPAVIRELRPLFRFSDSGPSSVRFEVHSAATTPHPTAHKRSQKSKLQTAELASSADVVDASLAEIIVDPKSIFFLVEAFGRAVTSLSQALTGTLMLLPPMIVARRVLAYLAYVMSDWYTGRYLRTTYYRWESQYWRYYQIPAAFRSVARSLILWLVMISVGRTLEIFFYDTFFLETGGCRAWSGMVWIGCVALVGNIVGHFIGKFDTPLMIQISPCEKWTQKIPTFRRILRPQFLVQLFRDPDSVVRDFVTREDVLQPFDPKPLLFPSTWQIFRILQMIAVGKRMQISGQSMHSMMRQIVIQEVLREEWYRVLMLEKRVALGIVIVTLYGLSTLSLFFTVGEVSGPSALLILPSLLAVLVSAWMNVYVYFERRSIKLLFKQRRT